MLPLVMESIREVKRIGKMDYPGHPSLDKVFLVYGLAKNMISITQLCG